MSSFEKVEFLSESDGLSDVESEDYEVKVSSEDDLIGSCDVRPYADDEENSRGYHRAPQKSRNFRNRITRVREGIFTIRSFTCIILLASILALGLLLASRIILNKRPYSWREHRINTLSGVISTAGIIILASFACAAINLLSITNNLISTLLNITVDIALPIYLLQAGLGLFEDERGRWSYEARDWCANPHHGGCVRLVHVLGSLNETAGYIAIGIAFIHIGLFLTRLVTLSLPCCGSKRNSSLRASPIIEDFKFSSEI
ncbi:hypothetical protein N431DRAFT_358099 [Stipitochalara longipes BDJ]|nr:hypothetical protein N431DRAFT_358099 [Stipitochalara longipes BDJ]